MKFCQLFLHESESVPYFLEQLLLRGGRMLQKQKLYGSTWRVYVVLGIHLGKVRQR